MTCDWWNCVESCSEFVFHVVVESRSSKICSLGNLKRLFTEKEKKIACIGGSTETLPPSLPPLSPQTTENIKGRFTGRDFDWSLERGREGRRSP